MDSTECYSNLLIMSVPDEGYSRNVSCTLNLISPFLFHKYDLLRTPLCSYLLPAYLFYLRHMSIPFILYLPDQSLTQNNQCYPLYTYLFSFWDIYRSTVDLLLSDRYTESTVDLLLSDRYTESTVDLIVTARHIKRKYC
jgi:hypothetical protein